MHTSFSCFSTLTAISYASKLDDAEAARSLLESEVAELSRGCAHSQGAGHSASRAHVLEVISCLSFPMSEDDALLLPRRTHAP